IRSIVNLAKQLEMKVVAEGVASESDAIKLSEIGCDYGQSFLFGPPIGSDSVQKLLKERFPVARPN
ncbi:MAG: EAL domain-containing protein, partial [Alphaproteobacteria bacterium]|nr:EAL domain-containing protein [Alphaproteobacteria bacterium]